MYLSPGRMRTTPLGLLQARCRIYAFPHLTILTYGSYDMLFFIRTATTRFPFPASPHGTSMFFSYFSRGPLYTTDFIIASVSMDFRNRRGVMQGGSAFNLERKTS